MQFSYKHLQNYFPEPLPAADVLATKLGLHSFELEGVELLENGDTVIDWDILPNRSSDCLSYDGIATEIAAVFDIARNGRPENGEYDDIDTNDRLELLVETDKVTRASKRYIENITVGDSPEWLVELLAAHGMKSVNNIVDMTTAVMLDTGQPVHAFDYDKIAGNGKKKIIIRNAIDGEVVKDLHGGEHALDESMIVIADEAKALDVAGIKGGANSGVDADTTRIVISACTFNYENIRNTAKKLKLHTDASKRFENEVPITKVDMAQETAAMMMKHQFGATVSNTIVDTSPGPFEQKQVSVSLGKINGLLGTSLREEQVLGILKRVAPSVGCVDEIFTMVVPHERTDIVIPEDLVEEVGRLYGYANIPETPISDGFEAKPENPIKSAQYAVTDLLVSMGWYEVFNRSITTTGTVKLKNPFTSELDSLRDNLITNLALRAEKNLAHADEPMLFEFGNVFTGIDGETVQEELRFAGVIGKRKIKEKHKNNLFLKTKGYIEQIVDALGVQEIVFTETDKNNWVAEIQIDGNGIGYMGVNSWEISFEKLVNSRAFVVEYRRASKYPTITRDIAFFVPTETKIVDVEGLIKNQLPAEAINLELFDVFEADDKKSLAWRITFQSWEETLSDEFANGAMEKITKTLQEKDYEVR